MPRVLFPRLLIGWLLAGGSMLAVDPRPKPADYPSHAENSQLAIGAEYLVHSFSNGGQMYTAPQYLVVDTAVYPHGPLDVKLNQFSLRVTIQAKSKQPDQTVVLRADAPTLVAYSITSSVNSLPPELRNAPGSRQPSPRPSDQNAPMDPSISGPEDVANVVTRMSLPEQVIRSGQAGYLYFPFSGPTKKIKALDLIFGEGDSMLVVKLF